MSEARPDTNSPGDRADTVSLAQMREGQTGTIVQVAGGHNLSRKLDALGITKGQTITKVSGQWMRGPVLLRRSNTQVALGFGMARRVFVRLSAERAGE